nr:uncharacterized protein LOC104086748 [Nicotiana tomentosiformis]
MAFGWVESAASEDITGFGGLPVLKKVSSSSSIGSSSSPKLVDRFPSPSVNPDHRRKIVLSIPEDARVFSPPVRIASYLRSLVTEEDQVVMNAVGAACLFSEALHALNRAEAEEFKKNMDILASKKETVQAQLESAEAQLQAAKEKASVQASLADELEVARSEVAVAKSEAKAKGMVEHAKWQARRESLEGVQDQGFDIMAEIEKARVEEAKARKLAFPKEDSESSSESEDGEDPEDGDATSDEDQAS